MIICLGILVISCISPFNIGAFVMFLYGCLKLFDNSIVSMKKVINWYDQSLPNASVHSFASNNNTNVMVWELLQLHLDLNKKSPFWIMQMSILRSDINISNILKDSENLRRHGKYHVINEISYKQQGKCPSANLYPDGLLLQREAMQNAK